ncbi:unnamed protein product [Rotaria sordida]|uniref:Uncharacterized protein n=1 Tax=Rotaria sordida TaxID=392033 RepID=A0A814Y8D7_9BILA|nr:unnamed protein product [Rotaria sordida]CAF4059013.1 unnamed protein product [Rotaria sordida]
MAITITDRNLYDICRKTKGIFKCEGCSKILCYNHFGDHRQELNKQLDEIEVIRDRFRQTLSDSIKQIRQIADEARKLLLKHTAKHMTDIEIDFIEIDLHRWKKITYSAK